MSQAHTVGLSPALPRILTRFSWWTEPVRAERLAALRIGVAVVLLLDIFGTYLPLAGHFFGRNSLGSPEVFTGSRLWWRWSLLRGIEQPAVLQGALVVWAVAATFLLIGVVPRLSAAITWVMSVSVIGANYYLHNSGDNVRTITLFYLAICPCGAIWAFGRKRTGQEPIYVTPWALRLLLVQLACIYFFNGVYKLTGPDWRQGGVLYSVMGNLAWTRFSYAQFPMPYALTQVMTWTVLCWELLFPLLVMVPWLRKPSLWLGVSFHVGTAVLLQLGPFPLYMLCLYLPLVPWEKYADRWRMR